MSGMSQNSDIHLHTMTIKLPQASVAQNSFVTKLSMEKSYSNSLILFSEYAISYMNRALSLLAA